MSTPETTPDDAPAMDERSFRYRMAEVGYVVLGIVVILVTVLSAAMLSPERSGEIYGLLFGLPFVLLFGLFIGRGHRFMAAILRGVGQTPERAIMIGEWIQEKGVMILTLTNAARMFTYAANGAGHRPRLSWSPFALAFEPTEPRIRMWVCAALMALVVLLLAYASWMPFVARLAGREPYPDE